MARTWLSIRVELISGHGRIFWPRPGRIFAAARSHTFGQLADAIDTAFARWDRAHLSQLQFADGGFIDSEDAVAVRLSALELGEKFLYEFDFGDSWTHLCTVEPRRIDPDVELGIVPQFPLPYWGWGDMPDQYCRRWDNDDGEGPVPPDPGLTDLPPLRPQWGRQSIVAQRRATN